MARSPIGCCGLHCAICEIYIASTTSDEQRKAKLAVELSQQRGKKLSPDDVHCWGCWANNRNCWGKRCNFRKCSADKGIDFCYKCMEFPCDELIAFYRENPQARENLTQISKKGFEAFVSEISSMATEEE